MMKILLNYKTDVLHIKNSNDKNNNPTLNKSVSLMQSKNVKLLTSLLHCLRAVYNLHEKRYFRILLSSLCYYFFLFAVSLMITEVKGGTVLRKLSKNTDSNSIHVSRHGSITI